MARRPSTGTDRKRRDLYQEVTDRIIAALERGVAPWVRPWRQDGDGGRPHNGASGRVYKGVNVILTAMAGFASSRWYTFNQAKALGGHVRKGEKGTQVVLWTFIEPQASTGEACADEADPGRKVPLLRCYTVFNAEQIAWPEGSSHVLGDDGGDHAHSEGRDFEEACACIEASGADIGHGGSRAYYSSASDYIRLPSPKQFDNPGDYYATALHELAHWTGHESRLARDLTGRFGSEAYAAEELVAELAAAFLCADLGVAGQLQHAEYIGSWLRVLKGDKHAVFTAARMAQEGADYLSRGLGHAEVEDGAQDAPGTLLEAA